MILRNARGDKIFDESGENPKKWKIVLGKITSLVFSSFLKLFPSKFIYSP